MFFSHILFAHHLEIQIFLVYESVSKSFRTGRLEQQLQMVQLSATRCSCIAILWVSIVSFAAINLCIASQRVFVIVVYFVIDSVRKLLDVKVSLCLIKHHGVGVLWFDSRRGLEIFLFSTASRTALRPTQSPIQRIPAALSLEVKRPGREADHLPPSSAPPVRLHGVVLSYSTGTTLPLPLPLPLPSMKTYWGVEVCLNGFLTSALDRSE
jgi:hypothetical protein